MGMRKSDVFLLSISLSLLVLCLLFGHAVYQKQVDRLAFEAKYRLAKTLELTDLCLFTEASYTRHLSQADLHTAFQDYPMSLDHFPSGSMVEPPASIRRVNATVD
jgi:hypothetical protein